MEGHSPNIAWLDGTIRLDRLPDALGSFALVGLKVTGPDMQATGAEFYRSNNLADVTVVSTYGLSEEDEGVIGEADGIRDIEYGYFKDVVIKGTNSSMRVFSKPERISTYDVVEGRMPKQQRHTGLIRRGHAVGIRFRSDDDRPHRVRRYRKTRLLDG